MGRVKVGEGTVGGGEGWSRKSVGRGGERNVQF